MAKKLQQAVNLSLDDYIQEKGIVSSLRPKPDAPKERPVYFKRPLQSDIEEEDEEENDADIMVFEDREGMQLDELEGEEDLGDTPPPLIREFKPAEDHEPPPSEGDSKGTVNVTVNVVNNSARSFVTEEKKRGKHTPSQQWRLQRGNQGFKKPYDGASVHEIFNRNTDQLIESLGENAKYRDQDARSRIHNGRFGRNYNNNNNNNNNNRNRRFQYQYGKNPGMTASFNPSLERRNLQLQHQGGRNQMNQITDLRLQLSGQNNVNPWQQPPAMMAFADMVHRMGQSSSQQDQQRFSNSIRNAMLIQQGGPRFGGGNGAGLPPMMNSVGLPNMQPDELFPHAAMALFEQVMAVNQNFGPKYDMKVQKEIHTLQDKRIQFNTAGVVSADGAGIEDGKVKPVTTDLSMNMRFR